MDIQQTTILSKGEEQYYCSPEAQEMQDFDPDQYSPPPFDAEADLASKVCQTHRIVLNQHAPNQITRKHQTDLLQLPEHCEQPLLSGRVKMSLILDPKSPLQSSVRLSNVRMGQTRQLQKDTIPTEPEPIHSLNSFTALSSSPTQGCSDSSNNDNNQAVDNSGQHRFDDFFLQLPDQQHLLTEDRIENYQPLLPVANIANANANLNFNVVDQESSGFIGLHLQSNSSGSSNNSSGNSEVSGNKQESYNQNELCYEEESDSQSFVNHLGLVASQELIRQVCQQMATQSQTNQHAFLQPQQENEPCLILSEDQSQSRLIETSPNSSEKKTERRHNVNIMSPQSSARRFNPTPSNSIRGQVPEQLLLVPRSSSSAVTQRALNFDEPNVDQIKFDQSRILDQNKHPAQTYREVLMNLVWPSTNHQQQQQLSESNQNLSPN